MVRIKNTYHENSIFGTESEIVPTSSEAKSDNTGNKTDDEIVSTSGNSSSHNISIEKNTDDTETDDETAPTSGNTVSHEKFIGKSTEVTDVDGRSNILASTSTKTYLVRKSPEIKKSVSQKKNTRKKKPKKCKDDSSVTVKKGRPRKGSVKNTPSSDVCLPSVEPPSSDTRPPSVNVPPNEYPFPFCAPRGEDPSTYVAGPPIPLHSTGDTSLVSATISSDHFKIAVACGSVAVASGDSSRVGGVSLDPSGGLEPVDGTLAVSSCLPSRVGGVSYNPSGAAATIDGIPVTADNMDAEDSQDLSAYAQGDGEGIYLYSEKKKIYFKPSKVAFVPNEVRTDFVHGEIIEMDPQFDIVDFPWGLPLKMHTMF